jgi:hypothetical protein
MKKPPPGHAKMKNGLYSVHIQMGDGVKGRASGVIVLRDGVILGGDQKRQFSRDIAPASG